MRFLNSNQSKKLAFHFEKRFWIPVFEISERLPKSKNAPATKWAKYHSKRIKLAVVAKVAKCHLC